MEATLIQKVVNELQCPTCSGQMIPPLMQCVLGHHHCNKCISEYEYCQKCQFPMGTRRNYLLENLCFSYSLKCSFAPDGCSFTGTCIVVAEHEKSCEVSQKHQRNPATLSGEAIRTVEDCNGQSLEEALFVVLECPVCLSVILPPIGECSKGHPLCHDCFQRVDHCPICRISNTNARGGCEVRESAPSVLKHEKSCNFVMKLCPLTVDGICKWQGALCHLVEHCKSSHSDRLALTSAFDCISEIFETKLSYHLFYIDGVLFRFGWYVRDGVYRFSVNTFGYVGIENRYFYKIGIFHRTANYFVIFPRKLCADIEDGDVKFLNNDYVEMPQEALVDCFNECSEITYVVKIFDHGL